MTRVLWGVRVGGPCGGGGVRAEICQMDVEPGPCRASVPAWYFNRATRRCEAFSYGGCDGNANRFHSEEQCERQCGAFRGQDVCRMAPERGPCRGTFRKYYFDRASLQCRELRYGGCRGNGNRFTSIDECRSLCLQRQELPAPGNATAASNAGLFLVWLLFFEPRFVGRWNGQQTRQCAGGKRAIPYDHI